MTRSLYRIRIFAEDNTVIKDYTVESYKDGGEQAIIDTALSVADGYMKASNIVIDKAIVAKTVTVSRSWTPKITYEDKPAESNPESKQAVEI